MIKKTKGVEGKWVDVWVVREVSYSPSTASL